MKNHTDTKEPEPRAKQADPPGGKQQKLALALRRNLARRKAASLRTREPGADN